MTDDFSGYDGDNESASVSDVDPGPGVPWGGIIGTLGVVLLVAFAVQNTETVHIDFLWWTGEFPLSIVILVTAVAAGVVTAVWGVFYRRRRQRRRAERHQLRQLREDI